MPVPAPDASTAVFLRGLQNLKVLLEKAEAPVAATGTDPAALLGARLSDDMFDLAAQARWTAEAAKLAVGRLSGDPTPRAIEITWRGETTTFSDVDFLTQFALPNVYFHPSMACAILRQQGVRVTRAEFTGLSFG